MVRAFFLPVVVLLAFSAGSARAADTIVPPELLADVAPTYPADAIADNARGEVTVDVDLDATGDVIRVAVTRSPDPRLSWAAMGALTNFVFAPAKRRTDDDVGSEQPIAVRFAYTMLFDLEARPPPPPSATRLRITGAVHGNAAPGVHAHNDVDDSVVGAHVHVARVSGDALLLRPTAEEDVTTDGHGAFVVDDVAPGAYVLLVDAVGYESAKIDVVVDAAHVELLIHLDPVAASVGRARETVVGARAPRENVKKTTTQAVGVIDAATLAKVRGRTLADTVTELPGVTMVGGGPAQAKPVVRGLFGRRLVILNDGVRHESQDWGIDHAPEIDAATAGQITVVKGAAGVRFGADAVGGAILLESRPLRLDPGLGGEVYGAFVDNGGRGEVGGHVDVVVPQLPSVSLRLEGSASQGAAQSTPTHVLGNTASETRALGALAEWRAALGDAALTTRVGYRHLQQKIGVCYCLEIATPDDLKSRFALDQPVGADAWTTTYDFDPPRQEVSHNTVYARSMLDTEVGQFLLAYALQTDERDEFDQARRAVQGPQFSFFLLTHALDLVYRQPKLRVGRFAWSGQLGLRGDVQLHQYTGLQLIPNYQRFTGGVFALQRTVVDDVGAVGDLEVVAGVRADGLTQTSYLSENAFNTQVRRGRLGADDCAVVDDTARCDKNLPAGSATFGVRQHVNAFDRRDAFVLGLDLSAATRFPDVDELYLGGRAPSFPVFGLGDAGLGTETTYQVSLNGELHIGVVDVDAGAFVSRIDDYIAFGPEFVDGRPAIDVLITGAYPRFSSQAVDALLAGADGSVVVHAGSVVDFVGSFAYVQGLDVTHGVGLPFMPPPRGGLEVRVNAPAPEAWANVVRDTQLSVGFMSVAEQTRAEVQNDFAPPPPGYTLWNAGVQTDIDVAGMPLHVGLEGRNLLNARYRDALSLMRYFVDQPGRELWLRVAVAVDDVFAADDHADGHHDEGHAHEAW